MKIKLLCTLGPASLKPDVIRGLDERGVDLFRINLSHTALEDIEPTIELVREHSSTPISLDTEGAQVRCGMMETDVVIEEGQEIDLVADRVVGTARELTLWPRATFDALEAGHTVSLDFDGALLRVERCEVGRAHAVVVRGGRVRSNKAVNVDPPPPSLPPLSDKDRAAIEVGVHLGIAHYALSFANRAEDVALIRSLAPAGAHVISKIESRMGVRNMDGIIEASDAVLIDRGDLSREVPLEYVPYYQKAIARRANRGNRPVFVATNLLESMVTNRTPTIAEANDIANTLADGVHGLVLAAETAIGIDPLGAADIILRTVRAFEEASTSQLLEEDRVRLSVTL